MIRFSGAKRTPPTSLQPLVACLSALSALAQTPALASTFFINSCDDSPSAISTPGTLRYSVANAVAGDTINLSSVPALISSCPASTITLLQGEIALPQSSLTFLGSSVSPVTISGNNSGRVFDHSGTGTLSINYLTIADGKYANEQANGGCIRSFGTVDLNHSTVTGCLAEQTSGTNTSATAKGGGIWASGNGGVILTASTVSGNTLVASGDPNSAGTYGGGVFTTGFLQMYYSTIDGNKVVPYSGSTKGQGGGAYVIGNLVIKNSTISNNYDVLVGGVLQSGGSATVVNIFNSTISGNSSSLSLHSPIGVGGLQTSGSTALISNSTIAANRGFETGGAKAGDLDLQSSIVANNSAVDSAGTSDLLITSSLTGSNDLVMALSGASLPANSLTSNPHLCPLANHGGSTRTHALPTGSPAIAKGYDPGFPPMFTYDQRGPGFARTAVSGSSSWTDIGAYQVQATQEDEIFCDGNGSLPGR